VILGQVFEQAEAAVKLSLERSCIVADDWQAAAACGALGTKGGDDDVGSGFEGT
jgi:hypothetical protein